MFYTRKNDKITDLRSGIGKLFRMQEALVSNLCPDTRYTGIFRVVLSL